MHLYFLFINISFTIFFDTFTFCTLYYRFNFKWIKQQFFDQQSKLYIYCIYILYLCVYDLYVSYLDFHQIINFHFHS